MGRPLTQDGLPRNETMSITTYSRVAAELAQWLRHYQPGQWLPSEQQLAEQFAVNRHTLRRAVDLLIQDGQLERQQGKGCRVIAPLHRYPIGPHTHFTEALRQQGAAPVSRVLELHRIDVPPTLIPNLRCPSDSRVIHIRTWRQLDSQPYGIFDHYLPNLDWWPVLRHFQQGSLHHYLRDQLGVSLRRHSTRIRAQLPGKEPCRLLNIGPDTPVFKTRTLNLCADSNTPAEWTESVVRADLIELVMESPL